MTIEYMKDEITDIELLNHKPYIGYFSPNGNLIDYNTIIGERGHDNWRNPVSLTFLYYISYILKDTSINKLKKSFLGESFPHIIIQCEYPGLDEIVKRGYDHYLNELNHGTIDDFIKKLNKTLEDTKFYYHRDDYDKFRYDLLLFFKNAYSNQKIFDTIKRKIIVQSERSFMEQIEYYDCNDRVKESLYRDYLVNELISHFKDICVQYLGYDSLEQHKINGLSVREDVWNTDSFDQYKLNFDKNPRVITTSYPNVNERFFNYLLMEWRIDKMPRYFFNEKNKCYEIHSLLDYYQTEKEQILEKEIQSIKKLVPLNERYKYFR